MMNITEYIQRLISLLGDIYIINLICIVHCAGGLELVYLIFQECSKTT